MDISLQLTVFAAAFVQGAIGVGFALIAAPVMTLLAPSFRASLRAYLAAGFVTGVSETATGIGGPPLALVYQHHPPAALRSTIAFCFLVGEVISLVMLAVAGKVTMAQLGDALSLVPALALGAILSQAVHARLPARAMRSLVLGFAIASSLVVLARA